MKYKAQLAMSKWHTSWAFAFFWARNGTVHQSLFIAHQAQNNAASQPPYVIRHAKQRVELMQKYD